MIAERTERIRLMMGADLLCALCQAGLTVVAAASGAPAVALVFAALTSAFSVVYPPAAAATLRSLSEDELAAANALNGTIEQLVIIVRPAIGAVLLLVGSPAAVFGSNAVSFLVSAALMSRIRKRSRPVDVTKGGSAGPLSQMMVGARTIAALPAVRTLVAYSVIVSFVYADRHGAVRRRLRAQARNRGRGLRLPAGRPRRRRDTGRRCRRSAGRGSAPGGDHPGRAIGYCLPTALLVVLHSPILAFIVEMIRGAATLIVDVLAITALQRATPADQLARVFGVFFASVLGAIALGTVLTPTVVSAGGLDAGLWVMALAPAALAVAGYPALKAVDRQTAQRAAELEPRVALLEGLGIFAAASRPILERLASVAVPAAFAAGTAIVAEGEESDALYVLTGGQVQVSARGEVEGAPRVPRTMIAPAYFGEIGVLERIPRTATVAAEGSVQTLRIDGEALREALTASPASSSLMENARSRLAVTHPARAAAFGSQTEIG
ncbi:MAG: cyclic nucleotide-binding domain-containing protein [Pseudonocardiales bacterium]|nr:cyclic nucleotide-binding domain-containing protein [Pseudonocardiales bacterium]